MAQWQVRFFSSRKYFCLCGFMIIGSSILPFSSQAQTNSYVYVPNTNSSTVSVIDSSSQTVVATLSLGTDNPLTAIGSENGKSIFISTSQGRIYRFDTVAFTQSNPPVSAGSTAFGLAAIDEGSPIIASNPANNSLAVFSGFSGALITTIGGPSQPTALVAGQGARYYIANSGSNAISVGGSNGSLVSGFTLSAPPTGLAVNPNGSTLYVTHASTNSVSMVDLATETVTGTFPVGNNPNGIAVNPDNQSIYIVNSNDNTVTVTSAAGAPLMGSPLNTGSFPLGVTVSPNGDFLYVSNSGSNTVSLFNTSTLVAGVPILVGANPSYLNTSPLHIVSGGGPLMADSNTALNTNGIRQFLVFNGGTLQATDSFIAEKRVSILAGGGTIDTNGFDLTITKLLEGYGNLVKTGAGTLKIPGNDRFDPSGRTLYNGNITITAGTLEFTLGTGGQTGAILNNGSLVFSSYGNYEGVISGSGSVTARSPGSVRLTQANTFTGGLTLETGVLEAGNSQALGLGNVTVSGGTLSTANGPRDIQVAGNYLQTGGTLLLGLYGPNIGQYDRLMVNGSTTLGGRLEISLGYIPSIGDSFTLVNSTGILDGAFDSNNISTTLGGSIIFELVTTEGPAGNVVLTLVAEQAEFAGFAQTSNQQAVARNLDSFSTSGQMRDLIDYLNGLPGRQLPFTFDQIAPEELSAMSGMGFSNTRNVFSMLGNRTEEIKNGQRFSTNGLTLWDSSREFTQGLLASTGDVTPAMVEPVRRDDKRIGFFVSGQGTFGDVGGDTNSAGYDFSTGGMILGSDYRITDNFAFGVYTGYQGSEAGLPAGGKARLDSARLGTYATWFNKTGSWLSANIGGGANRYDTERVSVGGTATGSTDGKEFNTEFSGGHDFKAGKWTFGPEAGMGYTRLWIDGFGESGSLAPLNIRNQTADSLRSTLAIKVAYDWKIQNYILRPYARLGWQHEFMDDSQAITARFASGAGSRFTVNGPQIQQDSLLAGAGAQLFFGESLSALLGYVAEANDDYETHSISGSLTYRF